MILPLLLVLALADCSRADDGDAIPSSANSIASMNEKDEDARRVFSVSSGDHVSVHKCCDLDSLLVESALGMRECRRRADTDSSARWQPVFHDTNTMAESDRPESYVLEVGFPTCSGAQGETAFAVYRSAQHTHDDARLLLNGSLAHRLVGHGAGDHVDDHRTSWRVYGSSKYCVDDWIVLHNHTGNEQQHEAPFAYICVANQMNIQRIFDMYVYPIGLSVSMACLVLTFLLYSFLPQLRDLTGKFILGVCSFMAAAFALTLVDLFGWNDPNVEKLVTELFLHTCVVGIWLCVTCMGHHVWKVILSKTVFTRVTDGQRLFYYTIFVVSSLFVVSGVAISVHFLIARGEGKGSFRIGWEGMAAFYVPAGLLLLVNVFFYWTAQRRISKQIVYNRNMQHFQVNFDLFIKFLIVVGVWWLFCMLSLLEMSALVYIGQVFNILEGPLIFCVSMCRTRVAFLFKRYFCYDACCFGCCRTPDFLEEECKEMTALDGMRAREAEEDDLLATSSLLSRCTWGARAGGADSDYRQLSRSLFSVRHHYHPGEVPPPPDPDLPVGRVKKLLKSNSLTAIANINWGWRRETSV